MLKVCFSKAEGPLRIAGWARKLAIWFCRAARPKEASCSRRSKGQRVELRCYWRNSAFDAVEPALPDHVHQLNAGNENACPAKGLDIGRTMRLIARWSCSVKLLRYLL